MKKSIKKVKIQSIVKKFQPIGKMTEKRYYKKFPYKKR
jgi:hypothetical protein